MQFVVPATLVIVIKNILLIKVKVKIKSNRDVSIGDTEHWVSGRRRHVGLVYFC